MSGFPLPPGERLLWQGAPQRRRFASEALALPWAGLYVVALVGFCARASTWNITLAYAMLASVAIGLLALLGYAMGASSTYSLTTAHVVIEYGFALPKCVTIPYNRIAAVNLRANPDGTGDIAMRLDSNMGVRGLLLWPHIRAWRLRPEPTLRAIPAAATAAEILRRQLAAIAPESTARTSHTAADLSLAVAAE